MHVHTHRTGRTYYLRTFGCQMNEHDSERISGLMQGLGYEPADTPDRGDVLLYNTCSIREKADTRLIGHLGHARRLKADDPRRLVVVAGCLAQSRQAAFFREHPYVDVLVGPQSLHLLPALLDERVSTGRQVGAFDESTSMWSAELPRVRQSGPLAWIQIMTGCSNYCSYCIVPYVRGPEASRPRNEVVEETRELARQGVREVTLLGQNVNAYGLEPASRAGGGGFPALLEALSGVAGIERIRFMTSHPKDVSPALIETMAGLRQVCEHLHLPVQSGSDRILHLMKRGYDRAAYLDLVNRLRAAIPGLALTTDLIIGFPSETERDFEETVGLVETVGFDGAFTFQYSPRSRTAAAELPGRIDPEVLEVRMRRLVETTQRLGADRNALLVDAEVEVLVEGRSRRDPDALMGRTRTHKVVNFSAVGIVLPGDLVEVRIERASSTSLSGTAPAPSTPVRESAPVPEWVPASEPGAQ